MNDPHDSGGPTNLGISLKFLKGVSPDATEADIRSMTPEKAAPIYKANFWDALSLDLFPQDIAIKLFDLAVNIGTHAAAQVLQRALRACGHADVRDDGHIGNMTMAAMRSTDPDKLIPAIRSEAAGHYRCIVDRRPDQARFLTGWLRRCYND